MHIASKANEKNAKNKCFKKVDAVVKEILITHHQYKFT